jgi:hypothetical protein
MVSYLIMTGLEASASFCARPERTTRRVGGSGCGAVGPCVTETGCVCVWGGGMMYIRVKICRR